MRNTNTALYLDETDNHSHQAGSGNTRRAPRKKPHNLSNTPKIYKIDIGGPFQVMSLGDGTLQVSIRRSQFCLLAGFWNAAPLRVPFSCLLIETRINPTDVLARPAGTPRLLLP